MTSLRKWEQSNGIKVLRRMSSNSMTTLFSCRPLPCNIKCIYRDALRGSYAYDKNYDTKLFNRVSTLIQSI